MYCMTPSFALPLEYDDSLSYMEILMQLKKQNTIIINALKGQVNETISNYIDQNFNDIMFNAVYNSSTESIILERKD